MSVVNDYLLKNRAKGEYGLAPRINCVDGFSVSVQVGRGSYCSPRNGIGPVWDSAELGFPSEPPNDSIMPYVEDESDPTGTVYGYVPMPLIDALIAEHGGIAS